MTKSWVDLMMLKITKTFVLIKIVFDSKKCKLYYHNHTKYFVG